MYFSLAGFEQGGGTNEGLQDTFQGIPYAIANVYEDLFCLWHILAIAEQRHLGDDLLRIGLSGDCHPALHPISPFPPCTDTKLCTFCSPGAHALLAQS